MAPLRIACFHSFRMSGDNLRKQMETFSNFRTHLGECELSFPDARLRCSAEHEASVPERLQQFLPPPYFEWWNASTQARCHVGKLTHYR